MFHSLTSQTAGLGARKEQFDNLSKTVYIDIDIEVARSCLTLCNPMDYSLPGSSVHGIFQARVLEWVAISLSIDSIRDRLIIYYSKVVFLSNKARKQHT